ncbi:succinate--CoA ligase subunit beta [Sulfuracidifex metallicus]|uniref:Succinate--CoA ligase subunit beta n=1 Tax=Sulfuracidifex metallicus DSM 6482 = JCM 9184 TaxID=523847 RepID=A0A6A9QJL5_SULME|nr:succinate--CoA ligase subunit beta [Sulfuracidifex metallicus]MUN29186.1 succinate--CoA ligase subunit beta [Sulfuracidifex metallicus DSM 6482 = JCM 9184]WOE50294.1 succinate--CoA ligase subunit beta [Sulfuracidifex metallicus DSM 6482 = JCM 9184]
MKLYEYEGKILFRKVGIETPKAKLVPPIENLPSGKLVVKAQILEGGRGKRGLVKVTENPVETIKEMEAKYGIESFLVEEFIPHEREYYLSCLIDRDTQEPMFAIGKGGINVEEEGGIITKVVPTERGVKFFDAIEVSKLISAKPSSIYSVLKGLYDLVVDYGAELAEINPLAITNEKAIALDSKVIIEDNSLIRVGDTLKSLGIHVSKPSAYVELDGDVGIIGNGAGLTMATMDMVKLAGGSPADFLDVGGGADRTHVRESMLTVLRNPKVKKVIANIYGGITRCDEVAYGIVDALKEVNKPVFIRLSGTNEEEGERILRNNGVKVYKNVMEMVGDAIRS